MDVLDRINSLQDGLTFDELTRAAGAEVHGVWAWRSDQAPVASDVDWPALGESFMMQLLRHGVERER